MENKFTSFILFIITILIITCMTILGINVYTDIMNSKVEVGSFEYVPENSIVNEYVVEESEEVNISNVFVDNILDSNTSENNNDNSNTENQTNVNSPKLNSSNYFYSQLDSTSKVIYNGLENNIENLKTGTYKVQFGNQFSDVLKQANGSEVLQNYYQSAIEAFLYDNPQVFYLDATKMFLNITTTTKGNKVTYDVYIDNGKEVNYFGENFSSKAQVEQALYQVENVKSELISQLSGSTYQKVLTIHNFLVDNISYDTTISKENIYNIYGALINKECVCEGYAKAFKYLTKEAGINSVIVIGKASSTDGGIESHAWNYVKVDENWYAIDVTWDDPVITGGGTLTKELKYKYLLKGSNTIGIDHSPNGQFTENGKVFKYPTLSTENY